jgi:Tat protein secretion system quality control protein TatD with DNase activity
LPAAVVFSRQLLLSENSSVTVVLASTSAEAKLLALLASRMTAMRENQGYNHFGINE